MTAINPKPLKSVQPVHHTWSQPNVVATDEAPVNNGNGEFFSGPPSSQISNMAAHEADEQLDGGRGSRKIPLALQRVRCGERAKRQRYKRRTQTHTIQERCISQLPDSSGDENRNTDTTNRNIALHGPRKHASHVSSSVPGLDRPSTVGRDAQKDLGESSAQSCPTPPTEMPGLKF
jgi:hypothetical protein